MSVVAGAPYSPIVRAGDWLVVSGQLGVSAGSLVEGVEAQTRQALANARALLEGAGASLGRVAKTMVFMADLADFAAMNAVYAEAFGTHRPARSTYQVAALPLGGAVEIEMWAYVGEGEVGPA
jgi:2-iminobutanoate/2-iminopropanoate deaminase